MVIPAITIRLHVISLQITLPEVVTGRKSHSLSAVLMGPHCVWLVVVGGTGEYEWRDVGVGVRRPFFTFISEPNVTVVIELGKRERERVSHTISSTCILYKNTDITYTHYSSRSTTVCSVE